MMTKIKEVQQKLRTVKVLMANMGDLLQADHLEAAKMTEKRLSGELEELDKAIASLEEKPAEAPPAETAPAPQPA